jgi:hypothetical protein
VQKAFRPAIQAHYRKDDRGLRLRGRKRLDGGTALDGSTRVWWPRFGGDKKVDEFVRLGSTMKFEAEQRAQTEGISVSEVISRALAQYLHGA